MNASIVKFCLRISATAFAIWLATVVALAQPQAGDPNLGLSKVVPVSPNAAVLGKFGDQPVSYFTGLPGIDVPFFSYGSGSLVSAVSVSYHAGGLKVADIPSWVGAGWNLNAGGAITRSVRGLADETYGFFNPSMTVKFMLDHKEDPAYRDNILDRLVLSAEGQHDTEPDIFYFNFNNYSGKFYYNQETGKFYTITRSNLTITYQAGNFIIKADDGNTYLFTPGDNTSTRNHCSFTGWQDGISSVASSWNLKRIDNSTNSDHIDFEYNNTAQSTFLTPASDTKYTEISRTGNSYSDFETPQSQACSSEVTIASKKLSKITFRGGYILFTATTDRCDLVGEKALDKIELFTTNGTLKKRFVFQYGYLGGTDQPSNCSDVSASELRKLKLKSIREESVQNGNVLQNNPYTFEYSNENESFPSRRSFAQDFWGYYNGKTGNTGLIPYVVLSAENTLPGANRYADSTYARYGNLKRINYPTKGYTDYIFESNQVTVGPLPPPTVHEEYLWGDGSGDQTYYERSFTINNELGGTNITFSYFDVGCVINETDYYDYPNSRCAEIRIVGLSPGTVTKDINPYYASNTWHSNAIYLPNGSYKMTARFNQNPPAFENFTYTIRWNSQLVIPPQTLAGGLRIKKIIDHDGYDHTKDKVKFFEYTNLAGTCSGSLTAAWSSSFDETYTIDHYSAGSAFATKQVITYLKRNSHGNYPLLTSGGSHAVYDVVKMHHGMNDENGLSIYRYSFGPDVITEGFPYAYTSVDWARGKLLEERLFLKRNSATPIDYYDDVARITSSQYTNAYTFNSDTTRTKEQIGLKLAITKSAQFTGEPYDWELYLGPEGMRDTKMPVISPYPTIRGWVDQERSQVNNYFEGNSVVEMSDYDYSAGNLQPKVIRTINSRRDSIIIKISYPTDYSGSLPGWLQNLKAKNRLGLPIEKTVIKKLADNSEYVISSVLTSYKSGHDVPDELFTLDIKAPLPLSSFTPAYISAGVLVKDTRYKSKVQFNQYDSYSNLLEQQRPDDMRQAFIWGYNSTLPVIKGENIDQAALTAAVNLALSGTGYATLEALLSAVTTFPNTAWTTFNQNLRSNAPGAMITTYTYSPLTGMTSETDTTGELSSYEYDSFGRLVLVKDDEGNIKSQYQYNYKQ